MGDFVFRIKCSNMKREAMAERQKMGDQLAAGLAMMVDGTGAGRMGGRLDFRCC
jgi:hypothetical protein